jgi:hypothetical protein
MEALFKQTLRRPPLQGWGLIIALPIAVIWFAPAAWPRWLFMWVLAAALLAGCKWLTWPRMSALAPSWWRSAGYLIAWPGLDAADFFGCSHSTIPARPGLLEWASATVRVIAGAIIFWGSCRVIPSEHQLLLGLAGMMGIAFLLHFGLLHLLSCAWRTAGVNARPLMNHPLTAQGISEFWGKRWNTAFRDLTHRHLFLPLSGTLGPRWAIVAVFVFSGIVHELVISIPAGGGYGGPTLYFAIQAVALFVERSRWGQALGLGHGWRGWLFTMLALALPSPLLFPPLFVHNVVVPFMHAVGATTPSILFGSQKMESYLPKLIALAGVCQLCVLIASALVPIQLDWRTELKGLPRLLRQLYWVYGSYVVLAIVAFGLISIFNAAEMAEGSGLARSLCGYIAIFWCIRLALQTVLDARPHLTARWLKVGYGMLTVLFACFALIYGYSALRPL